MEGIRLLITGFEPFGGEAVNPAWEAVNRLPDEIAGARVFKRRIPVTYADCGARLDAEIEAVRPAVVICVGQAGGRAAVTPECAALNRDHADAPDNAGETRLFAPIAEDGAPARFTTLPIDRMVACMRDAGIPADPSFHAGTYVCNHLYYHLLSRAEAGAVRAGLFVHVPFACEQVAGRRPAPSLPLDMLTRALLLCAETAVEAC